MLFFAPLEHPATIGIVARSPLTPWCCALLAVSCWLAGCATALGPGYIVEKQNIRVTFSDVGGSAVVAITAEYRLTNTGNRDLLTLQVRLPSRRLRANTPQAQWDLNQLAGVAAPDNARDTLYRFPQMWKVGESHTLRFSYEIQGEPANQESAGVFAEAFYLRAEGWAPQLPQARGVFGFGGVPPAKWELSVSVPQDFLIHASGRAAKRTGSSRQQNSEYRFTQTAEDMNPFVIAGRYKEATQKLPRDQTVHIWTRSEVDAGQLRRSGEALARTLASYETLLGPLGKSRAPLWIVECPAPAGCVAQAQTSYTALLYGQEQPRAAEMISRDAVIVEPRETDTSLEAAAGPALAEGWLGYGKNPGFYEQQPPMSALPAFAAAMARENAAGSKVREEIIGRAILAVPENAGGQSEKNSRVTRAKSLLLFYALRERVGQDAFQRAIQHMLYARRSRGFDVTDLIAALEEESHQSVGPFVRDWIKRPGLPEEFRRRNSAAGASSLLQESSSQRRTQ